MQCQPEYSEEQVTTLRHIIITDHRAKCLDKAEIFATCDQTDGFAMFNTHTGNTVIAGIPGEVKKALKKKSLPEQFDSLFALTYCLHSYESWMHDNEGSIHAYDLEFHVSQSHCVL